MLKVFSTEHQDYKVTKATKKCVSRHLCPILFELRYPVTSILHYLTLESSRKFSKKLDFVSCHFL